MTRQHGLHPWYRGEHRRARRESREKFVNTLAPQVENFITSAGEAAASTVRLEDGRTVNRVRSQPLWVPVGQSSYPPAIHELSGRETLMWVEIDRATWRRGRSVVALALGYGETFEEAERRCIRVTDEDYRDGVSFEPDLSRTGTVLAGFGSSPVNMTITWNKEVYMKNYQFERLLEASAYAADYAGKQSMSVIKTELPTEVLEDDNNQHLARISVPRAEV